MTETLTRGRLLALAAVVVVAVGGTVAYLAHVHGQQADAKSATTTATSTDLAGYLAAPHLVFRNTALGDGYGQVAVTPLTNADGPRAVTPATCDRVYAQRGAAICLFATRGLVTSYKGQMLGADFQPTADLSLSGLPSRARISRDGTLTSTTTFVFGDSYANPGQFSTRTLISRSSGQVVADAEQYELLVDGRKITATDRNVWGVTFVDDDAFYATAASGGKTWLVKGSIADRRLVSVRGDVECPSLSPDGTKIAFKKHGDLPAGHWRLAVYDLASGKETVLAEERSVDDQVEWLDDKTVLYGLSRDTAGTATSDIWQVPADGSGSPSVLVHDAWSPAVIR
ncbi:TolB family protein [Hamadaea tsunoensis]|uniref:TolB family protein n=1 Tax=Hamadaea tsunoensis TaxID=53368 RepID=UPI0004080226|nr:hypothetical protein [Hamadaea tsunoensis]